VTDALRPVERELIDHVELGKLFDLAGDSTVDVESMRSWDESRTIRAWVIRDIMRGRLASDADPSGVRLRGARISGRLKLDNLVSAVWIELYDCFLDEGVSATDARLAGIALSGCRIEHPSEIPLRARRLTATVLFINTGTSIEGRVDTAVDLIMARLDAFEVKDAQLHTLQGPALNLHGARIAQDLALHGGFVATGAGDRGAVRMTAAEIGGTLHCHNARLRNDDGPALLAAGLQVGSHLLFGRGFDAAGTGDSGAVNLSGAHVAGYLDCMGATLRNDSGPALVAELMHVDRWVIWKDTFSASSESESATVQISGARFGRFECSAKISNTCGPAVAANNLEVDQDMKLVGFEAVGDGEGVVVSLSDATVRGVLEFEPSVLQHRSDERQRLLIDGLVYRGLPYGMANDEWLTLLRTGTPFYAAQPYQHLAAQFRAAGHDREVRWILMDQRRDQISRAMTGRGERAWARFTGLVLGYGYQPWRALLGLFAVLVTSAVLAVVLGDGGLIQVRSGMAPVACSMIDRIAVGLELGTPLISTSARIRCEATNTGAGQALTIIGWVLRLMAWAFATLFIAGFTGAVRKT
jgi:hypothetical protein